MIFIGRCGEIVANDVPSLFERGGTTKWWEILLKKILRLCSLSRKAGQPPLPVPGIPYDSTFRKGGTQ